VVDWFFGPVIRRRGTDEDLPRSIWTALEPASQGCQPARAASLPGRRLAGAPWRAGCLPAPPGVRLSAGQTGPRSCKHHGRRELGAKAKFLFQSPGGVLLFAERFLGLLLFDRNGNDGHGS